MTQDIEAINLSVRFLDPTWIGLILSVDYAESKQIKIWRLKKQTNLILILWLYILFSVCGEAGRKHELQFSFLFLIKI